MRILGIETSCDETAASVIEAKNDQIKVLSNTVSSQIEKHAPFGGVVPSLAAREHITNLPTVLKTVLGNFDMADIDLIAVTAGPGLISSLLVGTAFAKALAYKYKKSIVAVNHMEGHIVSNWLKPIGKISKFQSSKVFPALCLIVSGGHTQLVLMGGFPSAYAKTSARQRNYKLIGETVDDAAGEAFDKIARILNLGYPGGPAIADEAAKFKVKSEKFKVELPRPMINSKDFNFSFAGLKTAVLYLVRDLKKQMNIENLGKETVIQIAAATQDAIVDVLIKKTVRVVKEYKVKSIMLSGGVSANKLLQERLMNVGKELNIEVRIPALDYTTDNAAMIALAGYVKFKSLKVSEPESLKWQNVRADANWEAFK